MSWNHPTCQRNFPLLKLASPNEILICYYEHSRGLKHCLWVRDLKALSAFNSQTNGFQAGRNWTYPLIWRNSCWKSNLTICLQPVISAQSSTRGLMAAGAFAIRTESFHLTTIMGFYRVNDCIYRKCLCKEWAIFSPAGPPIMDQKLIFWR